MFTNYLKVALRNLFKQNAYSLINIVGLAVGIACCIAIVLFVQDELSYDRFNVHAGEIYRPSLHGSLNGREINLSVSPAVMGQTGLQELPDVAAYTRLWRGGFPVVRYKDKTFSEERFFWGDSTFFDVFSIPLVEGNTKTALSQPNTLLVTESTARRYFGSESAIGKVLNMDNRTNYVVTGVIQDVPRNSHFHFDFLASLTTLTDSRNPTWLSNNYHTYLRLRVGTELNQFRKEFDRVVDEHVASQVKPVIGVTLEEFKKAGNRYGFQLDPLTSIHLTSHLDYELEPNSDISYIYIFSAIAFAILLIACINFVNLSTARSDRRAKEVGIRKTLGSNRAQLVRQFVAESILMSSAAVFLAVGIVELFLPFFNGIADKQMRLSVFGDPFTIPFLVGLAIMVGVIAGTYPAFYLSSFQPVQVMKGDMRKGGRRATLRSGLVIFQFAISITLFIGTFHIYEQLKYIQSKNLGFDKEQVVVINRTDDLFEQLHSFEHELAGNPGIISLSNSNAIPGNQGGDNATQLSGTPVQQMVDLKQMLCDVDFAATYKFELAQGRFFSKEHPSDTSAVVVNEATAGAYGVKDLVGRYLINPGNATLPSQYSEIVGVVKDFNYESLHDPVRPLVMRLFRNNGAGKFVSVRIKPGEFAGTISFMENTWKKYAGNEGFDYRFLDQNLQHLYLADQRTGMIATTFSVLAIFVACLGLLGLAAFITEQRTKEIGVRRVLGASIPEITLLLCREFTKWVLLANLLAWPLAYYVMSHWLQNFAYRISMGPGIFLISGVLALIVALITVSSHAIRAATANPVKALRYE
jgi:putative ABC transport system permease protein